MAKRQAAMTAAVILAGAIGLAAQGGSSAADDQELAQYKLTTDGLAKVDAAARAFAANLQDDPAAKKQMDAKREAEALKKKDELTDAEEERLAELEELIESNPYEIAIEGGSLSSMSAQIANIPPLMSALKTAGLMPRDFAKFVMVVVQASVIASMPAGGGEMPAGATPENVRFAGEHKADIERIMRSIGVLDR